MGAASHWSVTIAELFLSFHKAYPCLASTIISHTVSFQITEIDHMIKINQLKLVQIRHFPLILKIMIFAIMMFFKKDETMF
jgi:hypothetical protein